MNSFTTLKQQWLSRFIQALNLIVMRTLYRVSCSDSDRLPNPGQGALLVCNHAAYLDACLVLAALRRPVTFLIDRTIYQHPLVRPIVSASGVIPIEAGKNRREIEIALEEAAKRIAAGELVCIFAEGGITRLGILMPFRKGIERIMRDRHEPIIPMFLDGTWASVFGFKGRKFFVKRLSGWRIPVRLFVGEAISSNASAWQVRKHVQKLSVYAADTDEDCNNTLAAAFLKVVGENRFNIALATSAGQTMSYAQLLDEALLLAKEIERCGDGALRIGIANADSFSTVIAHVATSIAGKVAVAIEHPLQVQDEILIRQGVSVIVSPQNYGKRIVVIAPRKRRQLSIAGNYVAILKSYCKGSDGRVDDNDCEREALVFANAILSHKNILRSVKDIAEICHFSDDSQLVVSSDFSSAIGVIANIWLPLLIGATAYFDSTEDDFEDRTNVIRLCTKKQINSFVSLTVRSVGAVNSSENNISFHGFGDFAPVVTVSLPNFHRGDVKQIGNKLHTIGHPLPSTAVRVVNQHDGGLLEAGKYGVLSLSGSAIAINSLDEHGFLTVQKLAAEDSDGFISIKN